MTLATDKTVSDGSAADLLAELDALGIQLEADGERLRFRPREKVTADMAARMVVNKARLLAALAQREAVSRRISEQLAGLIPYRTHDGRTVFVNAHYRAELERLVY